MSSFNGNGFSKGQSSHFALKIYGDEQQKRLILAYIHIKFHTEQVSECIEGTC